MSCVGSPSTAIKSANSPAFTRPILSSICNTRASTEVAERRASMIGMPHATIVSISRALSPCAKTPTSLPLAMITPASSACLNTIFFLSIAGPLATESVGHRAVPRAFINESSSGVSPSPCSIVSTPARIARRAPSVLVECAETGMPALLAISTANFSSSKVNVACAPPPPSGQTIDAVSFFGSLRHIPFRRITLWSITARRYNRPGSDQQTRSRNNALIHRLFQTYIGKARAFSSKIAQGGKAGQQFVAQMIGRAGHAQTQCFVRHLNVPNRLAVRMQQNMRMRFDQSRHQAQVWSVYDFRIGVNFDFV